MEQDYFDSDLDIMRKKRKRKRKMKKVRRTLLSLLGIAVVGVGTFFGTIKLVKPDFDFSLIMPEKSGQVAAYIRDKVSIDRTTEPQTTTAQTTTEPPTTTGPSYYDYLDSAEFSFDADKKGNYIGNLLNGGRIARSPSYIYNLAAGKGIYRLVPSTEDYAISYPTGDTLRCLNLVDDHLYFINRTDNALYSLERGTTNAVKLAGDIDFAYAYGNDIYCIQGLNSVCRIDADSGKLTQLYESSGKLGFVGISRDRVFFTEDRGSRICYMTVDKQGSDDAAEFMPSSDSGDIMYISMENGYLYYYSRRADGKYDLVRKKFGSDKTVTLIKGVRPLGYPVVDSNKLYYAVRSGSTYRMREYNMNTRAKKTMLSVTGVSDDCDLNIYHGGEYDFIIGKKSENGDTVYIASGMYTSSSNVMTFSGGEWKY